MRIALLGPVRAYARDGASIDIGGARLRMLLARLALDAGSAVPAGSLIDGLWGADPPADAANALQALVSRLRKALRGAGTLDSVAGGYRLAVRTEDVDVHRFEELAARGGRELAAGRPEEASELLGTALGLWEGAALADLPDAPFADEAAARLEDLRVAAIEDRFEAELQRGRHAEVLADLEVTGARHPLRERMAALRMRALCAAGRQYDALAVYEDLRVTLAEELGVDPSADLRETHLAVLRGELDRPPVRSEPVPGHLPARLTSFIGRDDELKLLAGLMDASRLVTIVGAGGAGKTRLAVEAMTGHRAYPRGRVWFAPLAGVSASEEVADAVLGVLGPWEPSLPGAARRGSPRPLDRVAKLLGGGEAVLVLDNCEHMVAAVAGFSRHLLARLPSLTILATSREPLAITGEALCPLGPLGVPAQAPEPAEAIDSTAVRLFVERAAAVRPGFVLDDSTAGPVAEICRRLDGMPLALELAAARLRSMSVDQIARRLDDRFRLLTSGDRAAMPRQRTLLAVVEWSWDLLTEPERVLARRLSMFLGGATVAALEAVCPDGLLPAEDVVYVLGSLVEKSIVSTDGARDPRYRMLETVRAYATERLLRAGELEEVTARFVSHFLLLAERHEPLLRSGGQLPSIAVLDAEYANVRKALQAAVDAGRAGEAARFVRALYWYWSTRRSDGQFEAVVSEVLAFGDALPGHARAALTALHTLAGGGAQPAPGPGQVRSVIEDCVRTGVIERYPMLALVIPIGAFLSGDDELAERELRRAQRHPDGWARACAWVAEVFVRTDRGDWQGAAPARAAAVRGFEEAGDRLGLAMALVFVAQAHSLAGKQEEAVAAYERCIALAAELGFEEANSLRSRVAIERMRGGDADGAWRDIRMAQRWARSRGHEQREVEVLPDLVDLHRRSGEVEQADRVLDELEALLRRLSFPETAAEVMIVRLRMANLLAAGEVAPARELLPRVVAASFAGRDIAPAAELMARLLLLEDDPAGAATALGLSQRIRGVFNEGDPELRALTAVLVGRLGGQEYDRAYRAGAELPRDAALRRLTT
ncbi:BTAD domain-containing putative transcriptional regulator [Streptosporangium canum]|uniref:ATP-binding protein n=1 Tax=Streptosporangium canum TaxID=324952 RepID=UPI003429BF8B